MSVIWDNGVEHSGHGLPRVVLCRVDIALAKSLCPDLARSRVYAMLSPWKEEFVKAMKLRMRDWFEL